MDDIWLFVAFVAVAGLASIWSWYLSRDRHRTDEVLIHELKSAYEAVRKSSESCNDTTASAARVMGEVTERLLNRLDKMDEIVLTVHPNAAIERMHNLLVKTAGIAMNKVPVMDLAPPSVIQVDDGNSSGFLKMAEMSPP